MGTVRRMTPPGDAGGRTPTTRLRPAEPVRKFPLPVLIGAGAAVFLLLILMVVLATSGGGDRREAAPRRPPKPRSAPSYNPLDPEILRLEAEGKFKCQEGTRLVQARTRPDPDALKEDVRRDLERAIRLLNEGLTAYERVKLRTGKTYPVEEARRARETGIQVLCADLEKEGQALCDAGLRLIQASESRMTGRALGEEEKAQLRADLSKGVALITEGMNLFERSNLVSGNMFDTSKYGQARKLANNKLGELK